MREVFSLAAQSLMAGVFALAAFSKLRGREEFGRFATTVRKLTMRSGPETAAVAGAFAAVEALTAVLIAVPATAPAGLWTAAALLTLFIGVVFRAVRGRVFAECGCFGGSAAMSYPLLGRNALLLTLALAGLAASGDRAAWEGPALRGLALAIGLAAASALLRSFDRAVTLVLGRVHARTRT
ncbi:MauE/DoxX family redox-associated membrane protein [Actinomadura sp. NEAU-AAG7]|uniref:MauE/DoxX family redox-associated membrane protein n=1 Tax=Actinomadura sp. NEAU-AAG7 TaxID=2839640 RepID=UPI0020330C79|nr:MauE/DoxX family redox-associated membrane protein [Actinomadura sp. NEAU-AAG7]